MEPKDLKNSEELTRPFSDDSELNNEADLKVDQTTEQDSEVVETPQTLEIENFDTTPDAELAEEVVSVETIEEALAEENNPLAEPATEVSDAEVFEVEAELETELEIISENELATEDAVLADLIGAVEEAAVAEPVSEVEEVADPETVSVESVEAFEEEVAISETLSDTPDDEVEQVADPETVSAEPIEEVVEEVAISEPVSAETPEIVEDEVVVEDILVKENEIKEVQPVKVAPVVSEESNAAETDEKTEEGEDNDQEEDESEEIELVDYTQFSQIELVNALRELVDNGETRDRTINLIITAFNLKVKENIAEKIKQYVDEGGNADDFVSEEDPYENDIRELVKKHRQAKFEHVKRMEAEKEINLQKKYAIIEDIKNLLNTEESINRTFQEFRDLQRYWYELGPVPQAKMKDLWDTYHFHVENFYDYIKINKELRDLDLKKNLEIKISLCERAEELLLEPSVIRAFNTLQKYHEQWREIGPVPREKKDDIWERFKAVTTAINQKHQEFFEKRKGEQKRNLDAKIALCEKVEEICAMQIESHREWDEKSKQLIELQKIWRTIGFAPKRDNNRIYDRFRNACDQFFNKKRDFYSQNKELQNKNMQMKIDLCMEAEALKESDDWKKTTQQFIDIQKRWKEIGPVPRKNSDLLWKRFRGACDFFFDRKSHHFSDMDDEQFVNLKLKKELIAEVEEYKPDTDVSQALKVMREFQRRWTEIGHVPIKEKDAIQNQFRAVINKHFDALKLDNTKRDSLNFRSKISNMTENNRGLSKVRQEREKYMVKLKQMETDLTLLDNNIGFFANSKNAQALIADVNQKIEDTREKIEMLKEKIRIIDELDKTEY
jgi:hypothetical protein